MGTAILLGREFLVAGDIIRTVATSPTFTIRPHEDRYCRRLASLPDGAWLLIRGSDLP